MRYRFMAAAVALAFTAMAGSQAMATPVYTMVIQDAGGTVTQTDGGTGMINYSGTLGGFNISNLAIEDLNPNNPLDVALGSNDIFRATGNDTLYVYVTVSNLSAIVPQGLAIGTSASGNFQGSQIQGWSATTYWDAQNRTGLNGLANQISTMGHGITQDSFSSSTTGSAMLTGSPFSYTVEFTLHLLTNEFANQAGATTDVQLTGVPEPASLAIFGAGLLGFAVLRRKRA